MISKYFLTLLSAAATALTLSGENKPNIILIYADDLGYGDIQVYNPERGKIPTPYTDQLAHDGIMFTDAHSTTPVCTPSRYSILTGRYNWRTKKQLGILRDGYQDCMITPERPSIAKLLQDNGYYTGVIGKWHIGYRYEFPEGFTEPTTREELKAAGHSHTDYRATQKPVGSRVIDGPLDKGFDFFYGMPHGKPLRPVIEQDIVTGEIDSIDTLPRHEAVAVNFIKDSTKKDKPFFLFMSLNSPHAPIVPTPEWQGKSEVGGHGDFVMQTDAVVGTVLKTLDELGISDNTMIIYTSDNGSATVSDKQKAEGHYGSGPFRGKKSHLYEGGHRVPFIVRWPNSEIAPGTVSDEIICQTDLFATFVDLLNVPMPPKAGVDSVSFMPALRGYPIETSRKGIIHHSLKGLFAYRMGKWKIILTWGDGNNKPWPVPEGLPEYQLYDIENDPGETTNLYKSNPETFQTLLALLKSDVERGRSTEGPPEANDLPQIDLWKTSKQKRK